MSRDHLDEAIDQVAARLTHVADENSLTVERIVQELPRRRPLFWIMQGWAPGLAAVVLALTAFLVVGTNVPTDVQTDVRTNVPTIVPTDVPTVVQANVGANARMNDRPNVRMNDRDHEFSLAAIASPEALSVGALTPDDLPAEDALAIASLAIADLPLTAEFPRR